jgi:uncharacterized protein YkwD
MPTKLSLKIVCCDCFALIFAGSFFFFSNGSGAARAFAKSTATISSSTFLPLAINANSAGSSSTSDWLAYLNDYRAMASLPPVDENSNWSLGSQDHARYTVKNDVLAHEQEEGNEWYTKAGDAAAQASNIMASHNLQTSDFHAIDSWMQAPFHALGILDPALAQVGFGSYREGDGGLQMGATLDVLRGLDQVPSGIQFPIRWPSSGTTVPIGHYWGEYPDPLTSCPGYQTPTGLPIILQVGPGELTPVVDDYGFKQSDQNLESCVFNESTYTNPGSYEQALARAILAERDAIVLIPRFPLTPGATYTVSITVDGENYSWSFKVGD